MTDASDGLRRRDFLKTVAAVGLGPILASVTVGAPTVAPAAPATKPLKVLLITGGASHDHLAQKDILKKGLEQRANVIVELLHTEGNLTNPTLPILDNADYAKGHDLVIHDVLTPGIYKPSTVRGVLKPHLVDGIPAVVLHAGVSSYRSGPQDQRPDGPREPDDLTWSEFTGQFLHGHGNQAPIATTFTAKEHPIARTLADWTTVPEEFYYGLKMFPTATVIAMGRQMQKTRINGPDRAEVVAEKADEGVVVWTHVLKGGKTRVFSTSLGHNNATVGDPRYLDLVTNGLLWAADRLDEKGEPKPGYGPTGK
jgi:type 1 glutamine amidotransferase